MITRILEKDVRVALKKLEKLPLDQIRKLTKDIGGNKESGSDDTKCAKCDQILSKIFTVQDTRPVDYATKAKNEEEKLEQKLETIEERPLIEAESRSQGLDFPPKILGQSVLQPSDNQCRRQSIEDVSYDDIARKLMSSPPREIDKRILEAYNITTSGSHQMEKGELHLTSSNYQAIEATQCDDKTFFDDVLEDNFPGFSQEYSLDIVDEATDRTWEVERPQPFHYDPEYATYIEKGTLRHKLLQELEELGAALVPQNELMLVPLPPNQTSISSCDSPLPNVKIKEADDKIDSTSISYHTLPRNTMHCSREGSKDTAEFITYFSTPAHITPINQAVPKAKKEDLDRVPLSVLLKWARQRSMIDKEMKNGARHFSKGTCLPPLDFRPRSKTCPPRPCPTKKKSPCPPPKDPCSQGKDPCPPPKKTTCPSPKKITCPQPKMPGPRPKKAPCPPPKDPCPKSPCDPCKPPPGCPQKEKPCGLIVGNRIKQTISLILSAYMPLGQLRLFSSATGMYSMSTVALCPTSLTEDPLLGLKKMGDNVCSECSSPVEQEGFERVALARSFDPWTPIPSWPIPKKELKRRLICPKEGCPPPKPPQNPCKEQPCDTSKHRKFTADSNSYC